MPDAKIEAELLIDHRLPDSVETALIPLLSVIGVKAEGVRTLPHRSGADLNWLILLVLPLQAFLTALGTKVMEDLYNGVKRLPRLTDRPSTDAALLVLEDPKTGLRIVLEHDLPHQAYRELLQLDLHRFGTGPLHYDHNRRQWRSVIDEVGE